MSKSRFLKKAAVIAGAGGGLLLATGTAATKMFLSRNTFEKAHMRSEERAQKPSTDYETILRREKDAWYLSVMPESVSMKNRAGKTVHAKIIRAEKESDVFVICIHGYTSEPRGMATYAYEFHEMGYHVLMPDMRGHADSEHKFIGMGWPDRLDIIDWIFWLLDQNPNIKIILHGVSMGGATVMMTTGENLPFNVKCAIEDCGYSSVKDEFSDVMKTTYKLMPAVSSPMLGFMSFYTKKLAGFGMKEASSVNQLKKSKTPTLFIHGDADKFVPYRMLDVVYDACAAEKQKLVIPGAVHANAHLVNPELYWGTVKELITKYL